MPITRWEFIGAGALVGMTAVAANALWMERFFIETREFFIAPATRHTKNLKIIQISDLHIQSINYRLTRLADKINRLKPDLILITGDSVDKAGNLQLLNSFLKLIDNHIHKAAILGNWEYKAKIDLSKLKETYFTNNCRLLINETTQYSFQQRTVSITGLDDLLHGNPDVHKATNGYTKSDYHIILTHCPQYRDHVAAKINKNINVDFVLSGHTHGGQVNLFGIIPYLPRGSGSYIKGWYNTDPRLYVSKGVGTVFLPIRFRARAEIAVFNLAV